MSEDNVKESKSIIDKDRTTGYETYRTDTARRRSLDCGDDVAKMLRGKTMEELEQVAVAEQMTVRFAIWRRMSNPGQTRMALGNAIRYKRRYEDKVREQLARTGVARLRKSSAA